MPFMLALQILIDEEERRCVHCEFSLWSLDNGFRIQRYIRTSNEFVGSDSRALCCQRQKASVGTRKGRLTEKLEATIGANTAYIHFLL